MNNPILRGFRGLTRFSGRDGRGQFWPYAAVVVVLIFAFNFLAMFWVMNGLFGEMSQFAAEHPEAATVQASPGSYSIQIDGDHPEAPIPDFTGFFVELGVMILMAIVLLAAAVSRRLHDRNLSGFWGLLPVPFLIGGLVLFPILLSEFEGTPEPNLGLFGLLFLNNGLYMLALVTLIVLLCLPGTPGPNRFGAAIDDRA